MRAGGAEDKLARQFAAGGNQRPRQAAAAGACQRQRMLAVRYGIRVATGPKASMA
jgi:hypothetical protein